ncbi:hypothetical protein E2C01_016817 [Portunus trituberculatus]|uniref:Uncharacterized protein n=1 Tax=Portunus trituberculatus TaxID=210409 RepID=A0A5B7DS59_PORTR|nr:hypothetical protein [Portunus trituberculatus]
MDEKLVPVLQSSLLYHLTENLKRVDPPNFNVLVLFLPAYCHTTNLTSALLRQLPYDLAMEESSQIQSCLRRDRYTKHTSANETTDYTKLFQHQWDTQYEKNLMSCCNAFILGPTRLPTNKAKAGNNAYSVFHQGYKNSCFTAALILTNLILRIQAVYVQLVATSTPR